MLLTALRCMAVGFVACGIGCTMNQPKIPANTAQPLAAEFAFNQAEIANDRYMLLPHQRESVKEWDSFAGGKYVIMSSAWSGFGSGSGFARYQYLNLTVLNLADGHRANVFDRQVALGEWSYSFKPTGESCTRYEQKENGGLRFPNLLILTARSADTNNDKQIDDKDSVQAFLYDLSKSQLRQVSPAGHHVENLEVIGSRLILLLTKEPDRKETAAYAYDVSTFSGNFVAEGIVP